MSLSFFSLNIWRFYEWDLRGPRIIEYLKRVSPDIILLQEAQLDWRVSTINQAVLLNQELGYEYVSFFPCDIRHSQRGEVIDPPAQLGHAVLSRYPISSTELFFLTQSEGDKDRRMLVNIDVLVEDVVYPFTSIHFSNSDAWADAHIKEAFTMLNRGGQGRIMAGDFNIFELAHYADLYQDTHSSSADLYEYTSYPSREGTLDYILLPNKYRFLEFECVEERLSDHRGLFARIIT